MTYLYRLAGENLELAEAELKGVLRSEEIEDKVNRRNRLAETEKRPDLLKRLALTHEIARKIGEIGKEKLGKSDIEYTPEESFAVNCKAIEKGADTEQIEETLGRKLSNEDNSVDLDNPETEVMAYVLEDKIVIGELIEDIDRGLFQKRSNEKRPFSSPVSLDPILARVLVNLAEVPAGGKILDPFCGTGGILIEAGLCGVLPCGTDVKEEMVEGCRENLEEYGIISHEINQGDAKQDIENFEYEFDALVTDLPYGKASKIEGEIEQTFLEIIDEFNGKIVFMYDKPELGNFEAEFEIYVHKNLTRYVYSI